MGPALLLVALAGSCPGARQVKAGETNPPEILLPLGHSREVRSVTFSRDGTRVLTGSHDQTAILWDIATGKPLQTFKGHSAEVESAVLNEDGTRVLTGSGDGTALLWDVRTGKPLQTFTSSATGHIYSVALSKDGTRVLAGSSANTAVLWDASTGKDLQIYRHPYPVSSVAISQDSKRVLTGSLDNTAVLWDAATAKPLQTFKGHRYWVSSAAMSEDGSRVLTGSWDHTLILWESATGKVLQTFKGHADTVYAAALSRDGTRVLSGSLDNTAILWDAATGKPLQVLRGHSARVGAVAISSDGSRLVTGSDDSTAVLWDASTGKALRTFRRYANAISGMRLSASTKCVLTRASLDTSVTLWDIGNGQLLHTLKGRFSPFALNPEGTHCLTESTSNNASLLDIATGKYLRSYNGHSRPVTALAFSKDGKRILTGSHDKTTILWDAATAKPLQTFHGHTSLLTAVALSTDGQRILTGSYDHTAILWDAVTAKPVQTFRGHTDTINSVGLSKDGERVLTESNDKTLILWDAATGKALRIFKDVPFSFRAVALSPEGKRVLTGLQDMTVVLWDTLSTKPLQTFRGHQGRINAVAFARDDALVVSASEDGSVRLWKLGRAEPVFSFMAVGEEWLFWTPEGYYSCSPNGENLIAWKIHDDSPPGYRIVGPEQFRKQFYRPDLFRYLLEELDLARALARADKESGRVVAAPANITRDLPPIADIIRPDRDGEIDTETITVEGVAYSTGEHPITRLRLLVDGRPYQGNLSIYNIAEPKLGKAKRSWQVELEAGEHTIQVIADNAFGIEGRSSVLRLRRKAVVETLPRLFVLAVGISAYDKADLRKGVYYCAADAQKFADTIERSSKPLYREVKVLRLTDKDATRQKILQALTQLKKQATQRDAVMIFFAGHGKRDEQNNFYFLPVEVDTDELASTGLSEGDFKAQVKALPGRVILLLDACHSGALIENDRRSGEGLTDKLYRDLTSNEYGLVVMCSSRGNQVSLERPNLKGGYFTVALVEGLAGKARKSSEGVVYFKALDDYVTERVRELSEGSQHPLTFRAITISDIALTRP
jgi:WD40 repeat protein